MVSGERFDRFMSAYKAAICGDDQQGAVLFGAIHALLCREDEERLSQYLVAWAHAGSPAPTVGPSVRKRLSRKERNRPTKPRKH